MQVVPIPAARRCGGRRAVLLRLASPKEGLHCFRLELGPAGLVDYLRPCLVLGLLAVGLPQSTPPLLCLVISGLRRSVCLWTECVHVTRSVTKAFDSFRKQSTKKISPYICRPKKSLRSRLTPRLFFGRQPHALLAEGVRVAACGANAPYRAPGAAGGVVCTVGRRARWRAPRKGTQNKSLDAAVA